jgi:hypothetical protein
VRNANSDTTPFKDFYVGDDYVDMVSTCCVSICERILEDKQRVRNWLL